MDSGVRTVTVAWDDDAQTMLRFDFARRWTWADVHVALVRATDMIDSLHHKKPIGMMMIPTSSYIAPNIMSEATRELLTRHPRIVLIILVTDHVLQNVIAKAFVRLIPQMHGVYFVVPSLNAAREMMQQLPDRPATSDLTLS